MGWARKEKKKRKKVKLTFIIGPPSPKAQIEVQTHVFQVAKATHFGPLFTGPIQIGLPKNPKPN
jgi:hypothetical protein